METKVSASSSPELSPNHRIKLNIGGKIFETTVSTLQSSALLASLSISTPTQPPIFIDRNPDIFSPLLSLLRTHRLHSTALRHFSLHQLVNESQFYGLHSCPLSSFSPPPFSPFDASFVTSISPPSSAIVSDFSASSTTSLLLAHSGKISYYDATTLSHSSTLRTHLDGISAIAAITPNISAVGSNSSAGLHFYTRADHVGSLYWVDNSDTRVQKSRVTSISDSVGNGGESVFSAAFECKHGENAVLIVDKSTLKVVVEIGRQSGNSAKSSAIRKLRWVPQLGLLVGSAVNCGAFGYSGYVRLWDPRSGEMIWETNEPGGMVRNSRLGDTMGDIDVDPEGLYLAKVGSKTGDLGVADLRKLGSDPWVYLKDPNPGLSANWKDGGSVVVHCFKGNVFVGRDGGLEAWSKMEEREVVEGGGDEMKWSLYRRNYVDKVEDSERGIIRKIEGGGNRLFVSRENVEGIEVWETSRLSGVKAV
ncbi:hypothetical protein SOVF_037440 isoform A [Spinacia oleracea]|uniref:Protein ENDOPLASMIC RETICULUM-ARRESTED PEN3 n=1 Tax=Spinacia oleracea TaxID=3562 RepID=A0A9R0JYZ3_SPIOL|nr:protein ENDOPLASMIC RETICULUM-ARRESTED PEN3 [Spinacia oleracea]XP_056697010.1 protein ENDOPLASMIC RETICULUM-ARRESTED PEN3 [Spinacia oleracea]XP_056697011.1 protein ENDOPLASMIC RETICULUM-ARRESTED PEN3 [Spinacia oleracea]XP_056697012.1 protein ENDOPLASMIC RETICULUM-ARRESTED PEN3 [Spinacia oleracea]XP_056697013.1 protein ENDOPLASMIC RETICULUM-ARRESTED PEN3 [Spinacia oleracea]XP_056697014.1 protein ENDOPLASMIC RETICULUM-ARRESTED PEN3 [Spinacia oleracea]XP_056697015.1 protein ENDOPLASMIC RETICU